MVIYNHLVTLKSYVSNFLIHSDILFGTYLLNSAHILGLKAQAQMHWPSLISLFDAFNTQNQVGGC